MEERYQEEGPRGLEEKSGQHIGEEI